MLNVGDTIQIGDKNATVCYTAKYNEENYICVAFETDKIEYNIYKYIYDNDNLLVSDVIPENDMREVLTLFVKEGLDEYGLPEELEEIFAEVDINN